jgi:catechol 2,3-dioxygenase-like lactoylglutathione lyase family enzyme
MKPVIDHIHVTVADLERAEKFYDKFMPLLGFDVANKERDAVPEHKYEIVEYHHSSFSFGIVRPRSACSGETISKRKPGALHHLAFHADSRAEVDRLYLQIRDIGAKIIHEPQLYPEYCKDYYAFFFKDSEGIEYEIVHFDRAGHFPL